MSHPIILYDGVCGLCNRLNQFVLRHDRDGMFRFASLQSSLAARILTRHGANPQDLDTFYVVLNHELTQDNSIQRDLTENNLAKESQPEERLLARSDAGVFVLKNLGGIWRLFGLFVQVVPRFLRDAAYRVIARHRYRIFGRSETCFLPSPQTRDRFLDVEWERK